MTTRILLAALFAILSLPVSAQLVQDSVTLGAGYANNSYYNFATGEVATANNESWHLAFDVSGFGWEIRINGGTGVRLYKYSNDTMDWNNIDTSTIASWTPYYNSDTSWAYGAFSNGADISDPADLGWGLYNTATHHVNGNRIYVVQLPSGALQQVIIQKLASGTWSFRHANLDGSNAHTTDLHKVNYVNKAYAYYNLETATIHDLEPELYTYDLVFGKYLAEVAPMTYYGVTGVRTHSTLRAAEYTGVDPETTMYQSGDFNTNISIIGHDWKSFDFGCSCYLIPDDLVYFATDHNGDIWRIIFEKFEGSSTGKIVFSKEKVFSVGIAETPERNTLAVYPNPAVNNAYINLPEGVSSNALVTIVSATGQVAQRQQVNTTTGTAALNLENLASGLYIVQLQSDNQTWSQRLLVD